MNAALRLSQRASSRKISHVLSGNTRSLSSTSSPAARASAIRTAAFATAYQNASSSRVLSHIRAYSTQPEPTEEQDKIREAFKERPTEQNMNAPYGRRDLTPDRTVGPSATFFVAGLPFFSTEEDVRKVFAENGTIEKIRIGDPKSTHKSPFAFVTMSSVAEALAIVESAKVEPFVLEGREIFVNWARRKEIAPNHSVFFANFSGKDLTELRTFLGPFARAVDNAWFTFEKETGTWKSSGMIQCRTVEDAGKMIEALNYKPGPDGLPVLLRYATKVTENRRARKEREREREREKASRLE